MSKARSSIDGELATYIKKGKQLMDSYIKSTFGHLPALPMDDLGHQVNRLTLNREVFAGRVACLQDRGLIINTVNFNPSRDMMLEYWITNFFIQDLKIEVT